MLPWKVAVRSKGQVFYNRIIVVIFAFLFILQNMRNRLAYHWEPWSFGIGVRYLVYPETKSCQSVECHHTVALSGDLGDRGERRLQGGKSLRNLGTNCVPSAGAPGIPGTADWDGGVGPVPVRDAGVETPGKIKDGS